MKIKISLLVMAKLKIKTNLIQKKLLNHLKNYVIEFINFNEFKEEYNKFMDNFENFEDYKSEKELGSVSKNQKKK